MVRRLSGTLSGITWGRVGSIVAFCALSLVGTVQTSQAQTAFGLKILENPNLFFRGTYLGGNGLVYFAAGSQTMTVGGQVSNLTLPDGTVTPVSNGSLSISILVSSTGTLVPGQVGDHLIIHGDVTVGGTSYSGVLLKGQVFAYRAFETGATDTFRFAFTTTGGLLAPLFASRIYVPVTGENSTYNGSHAVSFHSDSKGNVHGLVDTLTARVGDRVWSDTNGNGIQDAGENGVPDVTVHLRNSAGAIVATKTTVGGYYLFDNLPPATYSIQFVKPAGASFTLRDIGTDDAVDSDADVATGTTIQFTLAADQTDLTWDAAIVAGGGGHLQPPVADAGPDQTVEQTSPAGAEVTLDGSGSYDPQNLQLTYLWTWPGGSASGVNPTIALPVGSTTITLVVNNGTQASPPDTVTITVEDTTPPTLTVPSDITVEQATGAGTVVTFACTATNVCDAEPDVVCVPPSGSIFPLGTTVVTCTATDDAGNSTVKTFSVTVVDTTPPTLTVHEPIIVEQTSQCGTPCTDPQLASFMAGAAATDICDAAPAVSNNAPAVFQLGTTIVTFAAVDFSGNTSSATSTVTVVDTRKPLLVVPSDVVAEQTSRDGTSVAIGNAVAADICDANPVITNDTPAVFPLGTTTVTWTAKDASGNTATGTQVVTVVDTTPPTLVVPPDITVQQICGPGTPVNIGLARATDICDANPVVTNNAPALFPVGTTIVTWTATDASGNTVTGTQTVKVLPSVCGKNCTYTIGYWKNHPQAWPVEQLTIGGKVYTKAQALAILNTPPKGDATYILAHQLIGAKLNILQGADPTAVATTISAADAWLQANPIGSKPKKGDQGIALAAILDSYNNGDIGPGHCDKVACEQD